MKRNDDNEKVLPFLRPQIESTPAESAKDAVLELRQDHPEAAKVVGRGVVAFDRRDPTMKLDLCRKETEEYFIQQLRHLSYHADLYGMGSSVLDCHKVEQSNHWTAEVLGLKRADSDITRALLSALLGTAATTISPVHLETALFGIGSFIHAYPRFAKILERRYKRPFGEHTDYTVCWI
jgi:hypothetical protein